MKKFKEILEMCKRGELDGWFFTAYGKKLYPKHFKKSTYFGREAFTYRPFLFSHGLFNKDGFAVDSIGEAMFVNSITSFVPTPRFENVYNRTFNTNSRRSYIVENFENLAKRCMSGELKGWFVLSNSQVRVHSGSLINTNGGYTFNDGILRNSVWDTHGNNIAVCMGSNGYTGNHIIDFIPE